MLIFIISALLIIGGIVFLIVAGNSPTLNEEVGLIPLVIGIALVVIFGLVALFGIPSHKAEMISYVTFRDTIEYYSGDLEDSPYSTTLLIEKVAEWNTRIKINKAEVNNIFTGIFYNRALSNEELIDLRELH